MREPERGNGGGERGPVAPAARVDAAAPGRGQGAEAALRTVPPHPSGAGAPPSVTVPAGQR
ncbi:hypothetical protein GCM10015535_40990 [Streptomyces gelaticus]|uniref:Uncharacterized protein n=1 Tax=Streptomyces gelaticus TaxID=285446 RepID=A0ABQ2W4Y2_9ACTN|nr:hypothetical protein GCM10015535_40990 [Streptomyces gelaticus]